MSIAKRLRTGNLNTKDAKIARAALETFKTWCGKTAPSKTEPATKDSMDPSKRVRSKRKK
jgi:hypothetical protein